MKKILLALITALVCQNSFGQISFNAGKSNLEISGAFYGFYNYKFNSGHQFNSFTGQPVNVAGASYDNNRFDMRGIITSIEGRYGNEVEYQFQYNFAKTASNDPENPALMDAWVTYKAIPYFNIKAGFQKLPYSRASLVSYTNMPYIQRAEIARGEVFSRRDIGITLYKDYWNQRVNVYLGAYTGQGESSLLGANDVNGKFEYVGRVDVSFPSRMRYKEIDNTHSQVPIVQIGLNARVKRRDSPLFDTASGGVVPRYGLKNIQGTKQMFGGDISFFYKGFSAELEYHYGRAYTLDASNSKLGIYAGSTNHFNFGGLVWQLNYHIADWKSVVSMRYDRFMANDLAGTRNPDNYYGLSSSLDFTSSSANAATQENLSLAYVYYLKSNSILRLDYRWRLRKDEVNNKNAADQLRIGYQYSF